MGQVWDAHLWLPSLPGLSSVLSVVAPPTQAVRAHTPFSHLPLPDGWSLYVIKGEPNSEASHLCLKAPAARLVP